jgi:anthranilate/para-aminobenzoate synthase component I
MPALSETNSSRVVVFPSQKRLALDLNSPVRRTRRNRAGKGTFTISRELVTDRVRCMLRHVQRGDIYQVVLHTVAITAVLTPQSARAECIRDLVQEAQGLFMRGASRRAEQRLQEALKVY